MYCKYCGKHLYEKITFRNLFKLRYYIHEECEEIVNVSTEYIALPVLDKLVYLDYLFDDRFEDSDSDFLFHKYGHLLYERFLRNEEWSIIVFIDEILSHQTIILILKLADKSVLLLNVFNENFM